MIFFDRKFNEFMSIIDNLSLPTLYNDIIRKFKNLKIETQNSLVNYLNKYPYWGKINIEENNFEHIYNRALTLKNHIEDFKWLYSNLKDYRSKYTLLSILNNYYQFDFNNLNKAKENIFPDYFDFDLIKFDKKQTIVDLGAYIGDTVISFLECYGIDSYDKIYCYEITPTIFSSLQENVKKYPNIECKLKAVSDKNETLFLENNTNSSSANRICENGKTKVEAVKLDDDIKEKVTLIKMDIEGSEQKAIKGAINHIKNDSPILLLSVYHSFEDLYKIPKMIYEMNPKYNFYLRYNGGNLFPTEITLICIP